MKVAQSCQTLYYHMDYTVPGILQSRILEWVAFPFSRRSIQPKDQTQVSRIAGRFFTRWATGKPIFNMTLSNSHHGSYIKPLLDPQTYFEGTVF